MGEKGILCYILNKKPTNQPIETENGYLALSNNSQEQQ